MKRVAMISFHTCPFERLGEFDAGGMNVYIVNLSCQLIKLGWQVDIYTRNHPQAHETNVRLRRGVRVIHLPLPTKETLSKDKLLDYAKDFSAKIYQHINMNNLHYDVIHAHYYLSGLVAVDLKKNIDTPIIQTFHTLAKLKQVLGSEREEKRIKAEMLLTREVNRILSFTQYEKRDLIKFYDANPKKIIIIPPGVNTRVFYPKNKNDVRKKLNLDSDKPIILFVGRIDPIKDITTLIKAIDLLTTQNKAFKEKVSVLLVGGNKKEKVFWQKKEVKKIRRLITKKDLECCIQFIGSIPHRDLPNYYAAADVVVLPSLYESFGLVVLEAMATGTAVIASRVGGLQFLLKNGTNGLLFSSKNYRQLAEKIALAIHDENLRKKLAKNAYKFAQSLSWEKQAKRIASVYKNLAVS